MTSFDHHRRPLVIGIGGTTRAASSTERALGFALRGAEAAGANTRLFGGTFLHSLPHYAPENPQRTAEQLELIEAVRHADAAFALGVQWHPEYRFADNLFSRALFAAFGAACHVYSSRAMRSSSSMSRV